MNYYNNKSPLIIEKYQLNKMIFNILEEIKKTCHNTIRKIQQLKLKMNGVLHLKLILWITEKDKDRNLIQLVSMELKKKMNLKLFRKKLNYDKLFI